MLSTRVRDVGAVLLWGALIFMFSSIPHLKSGLPGDLLYRKAAHIGEFAILAILLVRALTHRAPLVPALGASVALSVAYAVTDEIHHLFVPGRSGSLSDVLIDGVGVFLGILLVWRRSSLSSAHVSRSKRRSAI